MSHKIGRSIQAWGLLYLVRSCISLFVPFFWTCFPMNIFVWFVRVCERQDSSSLLMVSSCQRRRWNSLRREEAGYSFRAWINSEDHLKRKWCKCPRQLHLLLMGSIFHLTQQNGLAEAALKVQWTGQDKKKRFDIMNENLRWFGRLLCTSNKVIRGIRVPRTAIKYLYIK